MPIQPKTMKPTSAARNGSSSPKSSPGCGLCVAASCRRQGGTANQDPLFFEVFLELFLVVLFFFFESLEAAFFFVLFFFVFFFDGVALPPLFNASHSSAEISTTFIC